MLSSKYWITNCILLTILAFSVFTPTLAYAAPIANDGKDWQNVNGNSWAWNYSPQTQISKNNVDQLEVKWIYPLGTKTLAATSLQGLNMREGSSTPPILVNGVAYVMTQFKRLSAVNMETGREKWTYTYTLNITDIKNRLPVTIGPDYPHSHGIRYWAGGDVILDMGLACDIYAVDAKSGKEKFRINDLCKDIPGNLYKYFTNYNLPNIANVGTYEKGHQFITVLPGGMHSTIKGGDSRHVTLGISMDAPYNVLWRLYSAPPQDQLSKDWALQECDIGFFQTYTCKEVATVNRAGLEWDFAFPNELPSMYGGVTGNWGQPVVDEDTGIIYTQTGNQGPYHNMSLVPGPRLYGSTIMAIDMNTGNRVWWLQPFPHDPYDYDCNWSGILAEVPTIGKVYMKGCKEGVLYVMDAKTGKPIWTKDVVNEQVGWGQIGSSALKRSNEGGVKHYKPDPFSYYDMREWNWVSYPATKQGEPGKYCTLPCNVYPHWGNGLFGTDMSYDPQTATLYHYAIGLETTVLKVNPYVMGANLASTRGGFPTNTTIVARDAATGTVKWTWYYKLAQQRAAMVVSSDMLFTGFTDGYLRFFDKNTGTPLREMNLGSDIKTGVTIGMDSAGNEKIFVMVGTGGWGSPSPGSLVALGLSEKAAKTATITTTATTTSSTTVTTTSVSTSTTTSATTSTVTTTSATTQTVTTTSATTATTTLVSTQPAKTQTTTVTSQVTQTSGLPAEVTYAAVGVAVIALIAAAVLVMRKK